MRLKRTSKIPLTLAPKEWCLSCEYCDDVFNGYENIYLHLGPRLEHNEITHSIYCKICREKLDNTVFLHEHDTYFSTPNELWIHKCNQCCEFTIGKHLYRELCLS